MFKIVPPIAFNVIGLTKTIVDEWVIVFKPLLEIGIFGM
jgi:hypothetical protein